MRLEASDSESLLWAADVKINLKKPLKKLGRLFFAASERRKIISSGGWESMNRQLEFLVEQARALRAESKLLCECLEQTHASQLRCQPCLRPETRADAAVLSAQ